MSLGDCVAILEEASWRLTILDPAATTLRNFTRSCPHLPRVGNPFALPCPCIPPRPICHRFQHVREKTRALVEPSSLQAHKKPHEAGREVRALLDLLRENEAAVQGMLGKRLAVISYRNAYD